MDMPSGFLGDQLVTLFALLILTPPKIEQLPFSPFRGLHLVPKTILKVGFPCRVERIRFTFDFYIAPDLRVAGFHQ